MAKPTFIWLGSRRSRKHPLGNKGKLLDIAASRGLPVPNGGILLHEFYQLLLDEGVIMVAGGQVRVPDPEWLHEILYQEVRFPTLNKPVAVRSAFAAEDRPEASLAGYFHSALHVDFQQPRAMAISLAAVWASALQRPGDFRRDVLVLEMVDAQVSGVAFTEQDFQDDLVNFTSGTAEKLVGGQVSGETLRLPKLRRWERPNPDAPPFARRLQQLLRGVRRTFGQRNWDIEWADDGQTCWLIQVRPITRPPRRNEAFTFANIKEIMPDPPSPYMTGIVAACAPELFAYYRQFDRSLPTGRPIIEVFAGRPLFNISLLTDMMRTWGLPTQLVTNSIGGAADQEAGFRLTRFLGKSGPLLKQGWAQLTAVAHARRASAKVRTVAANPGDSFTTCTNNLTGLFALLVTEMFNLTAALSLPLLILRRTHTLAAHNARHQAISTAMYTDLGPLRRYAADHPAVLDSLDHGEVPDDATFGEMWTAYLARHGHRGVYESDIARPRYHEEPAALLHSLIHAVPPKPEPSPLTFGALLTWPVWWQCRRVLNAREWWRYEAMRAYDALRQRLLALAETAVSRGQLPDIAALWLLSPPEVCALDDGKVYAAEDIAQRAAKLDDLRQYVLPDLLYRFDDLEQFRLNAQTATRQDGRFTGVSLTTGVVEGRAWVLAEPAMRLPDGFDPENTILIAPSVDAGWIPTFALVSGVVSEIGGDLSHGSIILREIGLPAITNVRGATREIRTGDRLHLEAGRGLLLRLEK